MKEKTLKNLQTAFAGESQASRKYNIFAKKAEQEGNKEVAKLFRAAVAGENIHLANYLKEMGKIGTTQENLIAAIEGETYEFTDMYPKMIEEAAEEAEKGSEIYFRWANEVEKTHAKLFKDALANIGTLGEKEYWVCSGCGHLEENEAPEVCPVCGGAKKIFFTID
jgi:rubrerythrin